MFQITSSCRLLFQRLQEVGQAGLQLGLQCPGQKQTQHLCSNLRLQFQERGLQGLSSWDVKLLREKQRCQRNTHVQWGLDREDTMEPSLCAVATTSAALAGLCEAIP